MNYRSWQGLLGEGVSLRNSTLEKYLLKSSLKAPMNSKSDPVKTRCYQIVRDDGKIDSIAGKKFSSYDEAYALLERYYADLCCSDDREYYRIENGVH